jgi:hypothetical protein
MLASQARYRLDISVTLYDQQQGGRLEVRENMDVEAKTFLEMAGILGRFHELTESIKKENVSEP